MNVNYKIEFHTMWHCGSGLAAGADVDALVIKDKDGIPYVPGKTIKGLIREAVEELMAFSTKQNEFEPTDDYIKTFGYFKGDREEMHKSEAFFTNAKLKKEEREAIAKQNLSRFLYSSVSQTAIDTATGTAKEHSLRKTQVVVPCTLYGEILDVPETMGETIAKAVGLIKSMGLGRTRGLGRCTISVENGKEGKA